MPNLMDDPTLTCDYKKRCENKIIHLILRDMEDGDNIEFIRNKWEEIYKDNEEEDK